MIRLSRGLALFLLLISAALGTLAQDSTPPQHGVLWIDPNAGSTVSSAPPGAHLTYFGGPVISNVHVVQVLYGSGSYAPQVSGTTTPSLSTFFTDITNSGFMTLLNQYSTTIAGGTNQTIGNGIFDGLFQIVPSASNNGGVIDDTQIQAELLAQIAAGHLPSPILDVAGNVNTIYMIYFPPGKTITEHGSSSCVQFCAYHGTTSNLFQSKHVLYSVHPDMQSGGCSAGCGKSSVFGNYTTVTSHELAEAITDPQVGLATVIGLPLAWYDRTNGEVGDICNLQQGTYVANGTAYIIQLEFSNAANNCVLPPATPMGFSLSASPVSLTINQGASGNSTIRITPAGGFTGAVTLSALGLPSGVTAAFNPNPATSTSVVTLTATATATSGPATITIRGVSGSLPVQSTNVALTVNAVPAVSLTPSSLIFPDTVLGSSSASQTVTLGNTGSAPLLITTSGISISSDFTQSNNCPSSLAPNTTCTFTVTFRPTVTGAHPNSNLTIPDNAPGSPHQVPLSGNGVVPVPVFSPTALNFGNQTLGATSPVQQVTLSNTGTAPLLILTPIGISGNFSQTNNCPASLAVNAQCTFSIAFTPATAGQQTTVLSISDNAPGSPHQVPLSGNGTPLLSPASLTFAGQIVLTQSSPQIITITNNTGSAFVFPAGGIFINSPDFTFSTTCASPLALNASCTISVTFTPSATGTRTAMLSITDNVPGSPQFVSLSGTGLPLIPVLNTISPSAVTTGSSDFRLFVNGSSFAGNAVVQVNGSPRPTRFINFGQLSAAIPASDLTGSQPLSITVFNPLPSAASSAAVPLTLTNNPIPLISNVSPVRVRAGENNPALQLTVNGSFFSSDSVVQIAGNNRTTRFISSHQLVATILPSDQTASGLPPITVISATAGTSANTVPLVVFKYGDLNFDNTINVSDLLVLANILAGNIVPQDPAPTDLNLDGIANVSDLITLANYLAGNIFVLPVMQDQTLYLFNAGAPVALSPPAFPGQTVGNTSDPVPLTLTNGGPTPLTVSNIIVTGNFAQTNNCGTLAATQSCTINVTFTPTAAGAISGTITIQDNALNNPQTATLSGLGIGNAAPTAMLSIGGAVVDSPALAFGSQSLGTDSTSQIVTLTNQGPGRITFQSIAILPDGDFHQISDCGISLAAGASCSIYVTFSPTAAGTRSATLVITDNAGNSPQTVSLSGTGVTNGPM